MSVLSDALAALRLTLDTFTRTSRYSRALLYGVRPDGDAQPVLVGSSGELLTNASGSPSGPGGEAYPNADDPRQWPQDSLAMEEEYDLPADGTPTKLQDLWGQYLAYYNAGVVTRWTVQAQAGTVRVGMAGNVVVGKGLRLEEGDAAEGNRSEFGIASHFAAQGGAATILVRVYYVGSNPTGD